MSLPDLPIGDNSTLNLDVADRIITIPAEFGATTATS